MARGDKDALLAYVKEHNIDDMVLEYVDGLLQNKPTDKVQFWYDMLMKQMSDSINDDQEDDAGSAVTESARAHSYF